MKSSKWKVAAIVALIIGGLATSIVSGVLVWHYAAGRFGLPHSRRIKAEAILPQVVAGPGGIPSSLGWRELSSGKQDGEHDPSTPPGESGCYGLAWHVKGYANTVIVFQDKRELQFGPGGWYVQIRLPDQIQMTAGDIGRIQADWLQKTYGGSWKAQVLR